MNLRHHARFYPVHKQDSDLPKGVGNLKAGTVIGNEAIVLSHISTNLHCRSRDHDGKRLGLLSTGTPLYPGYGKASTLCHPT